MPPSVPCSKFYIFFYKSAFSYVSENFPEYFSVKEIVGVAPPARKGTGGRGCIGGLDTPSRPLFMYDTIYNKDCTNTMKLQDLHPYDSAIVGLNNVYRVDYNGDFFINAPFIVARTKKISTGSTFVLIYSRNRIKNIIQQVRLQDAYYSEGKINLVLQDILSQETFTIEQLIECTEDNYRWILIDFDYLVEELNSEIIKSYCGNCTDTKKKSVVDSNHRKLNDDLLEFDF